MKDKPNQMPTTCQQCAASLYKLPDSKCAFKKVKEIKEAQDYFSKELGMGIVIHLARTNNLEETVAVLWSEAQRCIKNIPQRALHMEQKAQQEATNKEIAVLKTGIKEILQKIDDIMTNSNDHIFKDEKEIDTPIYAVKKATKETNQSDNNNTKNIVPTSKWKRYQPNVKQENVEKYLKKLATVHPELKDEIKKVLEHKQSDLVRVEKNKFGNGVIEYKDI